MDLRPPSATGSRKNNQMNNLIIGLAVSLVLFGLIYYAAKPGIEWKAMLASHLNDPDYWYGPFYVNNNDNRIFLQKKRAGGYTVNLGNPIGIIVTLIFLGLLGWLVYLGS